MDTLEYRLLPTMPLLPFSRADTVHSARSGDIFGDGHMLVVRTSEGRADSLGQLVGTEQTVDLNYLALAVNPFGLYCVEPRALLGQQTTDDPHPLPSRLF